MADRFSAGRRGWPVASPVATDRILVATCAAIWLVLVGVSVAAVVALTDLSSGFSKSPGSQHTPAALYAVIIVSALVIAGAIPVLLRARRISQARSTSHPAGNPLRRSAAQTNEPGYFPPPAVAAERGTERTPTLQAAALSDAEVDRIWLRGSVTLLAVMGGALIFVAVATYLMAIGRDSLAWTSYGLAAAVTIAMPVLVWWHDRQMHRMLTAGTAFE
jgi:hypothetical protein